MQLKSDEISIINLLKLFSFYLEYIIRKAVITRKIRKGGIYSPEIRGFALTLHFCYSSKAYNQNNLSSNPFTIRNHVVDGYPGFTTEALNAIALRNDNNSKPLINLVIPVYKLKSAVCS